MPPTNSVLNICMPTACSEKSAAFIQQLDNLPVFNLNAVSQNWPAITGYAKVDESGSDINKTSRSFNSRLRLFNSFCFSFSHKRRGCIILQQMTGSYWKRLLKACCRRTKASPNFTAARQNFCSIDDCAQFWTADGHVHTVHSLPL